jgi:hypothetical protein
MTKVSGRALALLLLALPALGLSCAKKGDADDTKKVGRGSDACNAWLNAFCDFSTKCNPTSASDLCESAKGIDCQDDAAANDCAKNIAAASCQTFPKGCAASDLADAASAKRSCLAWYDALCDAHARCGADKASCVAALSADTSCDRAIGMRLDYENCVTEMQSIECGANLPAECMGLVVVGQ